MTTSTAKQHHSDSEAEASNTTPLREATMADYQRVMELYFEFDTIHWNLRPAYYQRPKKPARSPRFYLEAIFHPSKKLLVAEIDGRVIGFMHLTISDAYKRDLLAVRKTLVVHEVMVEKPEVNGHVSRMFYGYTRTIALAEGCDDVVVDSDADNVRSQKYLIKHGMTPVNIRLQAIVPKTEEFIAPLPPSFLTRLGRKLATLKILFYSFFWRPHH